MVHLRFISYICSFQSIKKLLIWRHLLIIFLNQFSWIPFVFGWVFFITRNRIPTNKKKSKYSTEKVICFEGIVSMFSRLYSILMIFRLCALINNLPLRPLRKKYCQDKLIVLDKKWKHLMSIMQYLIAFFYSFCINAITFRFYA